MVSIVNNNKNILLEKKYNNENLISIEKITDSSLSLRKDSVMTFENTVFQNEGDNVYLTTFAKQVYKSRNSKLSKDKFTEIFTERHWRPTRIAADCFRIIITQASISPALKRAVPFSRARPTAASR